MRGAKAYGSLLGLAGVVVVVSLSLSVPVWAAVSATEAVQPQGMNQPAATTAPDEPTESPSPTPTPTGYWRPRHPIGSSDARRRTCLK